MGPLHLVTGAGSGLGRSLALQLSREKAALILNDLDGAAVEATAALCRQEGAEVKVVVADVTAGILLYDAVQALPGGWRLPDVIIANAGLGGFTPGYAFDPALFRLMTAVNYDGMVNTLMPFVPGMIERRSGVLVGISSLAALRGLANAGAYSASKAAQMTFLESLRVDLAPFGIAVCCVHPGFIATRMTEHDEHPMPFKISSERAAALVLDGISHRRSQIYFPRIMGIVARLNRLLPNWLYDLIARRTLGPPNKRSLLFGRRHGNVGD